MTTGMPAAGTTRRDRRVGTLRRPVVLWTLISCAVLSVGVGAAGPVAAAPSPQIAVGITHTQYSADQWNPEAATDRAVALAARTTTFGNQHLMGWGALNPEPYPGRYDWVSLDRRMELIRSTGAEPVITLCCAPDWMKGGRAGATDWSTIEVAPSPEHFDDFAALAAQTARRYPDVKHFQVWNELKGFWDSERNRWDIESYTRLYNAVYLALKAVDPSIRVGGPYVPMTSFSSASTMSHPSGLSGPWGVVDQRALDAVDYWLEHKAGADFVAVDGWSRTEDEGLITTTGQGNEKFAAVTRWIAARTDLPIWWSELYADTPGDEDYASPARALAMIDAITKIAAAGGDVVLLWQPEGRPTLRSPALWTPTTTADGGRTTAFGSALSAAVQGWHADGR